MSSTQAGAAASAATDDHNKATAAVTESVANSVDHSKDEEARAQSPVGSAAEQQEAAPHDGAPPAQAAAVTKKEAASVVAAASTAADDQRAAKAAVPSAAASAVTKQQPSAAASADPLPPQFRPTASDAVADDPSPAPSAAAAGGGVSACTAGGTSSPLSSQLPPPCGPQSPTSSQAAAQAERGEELTTTTTTTKTGAACAVGARPTPAGDLRRRFAEGCLAGDDAGAARAGARGSAALGTATGARFPLSAALSAGDRGAGDRRQAEADTAAVAGRLASMGSRMQAFSAEEAAVASVPVSSREENAHGSSNRTRMSCGSNRRAETSATRTVSTSQKESTHATLSPSSSSASPPSSSSSLPSSPSWIRDARWKTHFDALPVTAVHLPPRQDAFDAAAAAVDIRPVDGADSLAAAAAAPCRGSTLPPTAAALHLDRETVELFDGVTTEQSVEKLQQRLAAAEFWFEKLQGDLHEWMAAAVEWRVRVEEAAQQHRQQQEALELLRLEKTAAERQLEAEKVSYRRSRDELLEEKVLLQQRLRDLQRHLDASEAALRAATSRRTMSSDSGWKRRGRSDIYSRSRSSEDENSLSDEERSEEEGHTRTSRTYKEQQREIEGLRATEKQLRKERDELVGSLYHECRQRQAIQEQLAEKDSICKTEHVLEIEKLKAELDNSTRERQALQRELINIKIKYAETAFEELGARQLAMQQGLQHIHTLQKLQSLVQPSPAAGASMEGEAAAGVAKEEEERKGVGGGSSGRGGHVSAPHRSAALAAGAALPLSPAAGQEHLTTARHTGAAALHEAAPLPVGRSGSSRSSRGTPVPPPLRPKTSLSARMYAALCSPRGSPDSSNQQHGSSYSSHRSTGGGGGHGGGFGSLRSLLSRTGIGGGKDRGGGGGQSRGTSVGWLGGGSRRSSSVEVQRETAVSEEDEGGGIQKNTQQKQQQRSSSRGGDEDRVRRTSSASTGQLEEASSNRSGGSSSGCRSSSSTYKGSRSSGPRWSPLVLPVSCGEEVKHLFAEEATAAKTTAATTAASPLATLSYDLPASAALSPSAAVPAASSVGLSNSPAAASRSSLAATPTSATEEEATLVGPRSRSSPSVAAAAVAATAALEPQAAFGGAEDPKPRMDGKVDETMSPTEKSAALLTAKLSSSPRVPPLRLHELEKRMQLRGPEGAAEYLSQRAAAAATAAAARAALCSPRAAAEVVSPLVAPAAERGEAREKHAAADEPSKTWMDSYASLSNEAEEQHAGEKRQSHTDNNNNNDAEEDKEDKQQHEQHQERREEQQHEGVGDQQQDSRHRGVEGAASGENFDGVYDTMNSNSSNVSDTASRSSSSHSSWKHGDSGEACRETAADVSQQDFVPEATRTRSSNRWKKVTGTTKRWVRRLNSHFSGGRQSSEEDHAVGADCIAAEAPGDAAATITTIQQKPGWHGRKPLQPVGEELHHQQQDKQQVEEQQQQQQMEGHLERETEQQKVKQQLLEEEELPHAIGDVRSESDSSSSRESHAHIGRGDDTAADGDD